MSVYGEYEIEFQVAETGRSPRVKLFVGPFDSPLEVKKLHDQTEQVIKISRLNSIVSHAIDEPPPEFDQSHIYPPETSGRDLLKAAVARHNVRVMSALIIENQRH